MSNLADFHRKFGLNVNYPNYFSVCWSVHLAGISAGKWEMGLKTLIISEYNSLSWLFTGKTEAHIVPANWSPPRIPGGHIVIVSNIEEREEHGEETAFTFGLDSPVWRVTEQSLGGSNWNWFGCHRVRKMDLVSFTLWFGEKKQALALAYTFSHFFFLSSSLPSPAHLQHLSPAFDLSLSVIKRSCLSLVSTAVIKHPNPRQTGKESVYLAFRIQSIVRRSQCRKLEAGTAAAVRRIASCWLLLWPHSASCFTHNPGPAAQGWRHPQWASPSHIHH